MSIERPILFNGAMVRAILAGQKTQTRRAVAGVRGDNCLTMRKPTKTKAGIVTHVLDAAERGLCPFGQPGDRLWVRETWGVGSRPDPWGGYDGIEYRADVHDTEVGDDLPCHKVETPDDVCLGDYRAGWKPSIHMPRWACRLVLEITTARAERLQEISEADALAEGVDPEMPDECVLAFQRLWESINGPANWDSNPWVWVIEFKVVTP